MTEHKILYRGFHPNDNGKTTIKLNGKKISGEWTYGSHIHYDDIKDNGKDDCDYIVEKHNGEHFPFRKIISETVGQWVATDKNDKDVFDGDILEDADGNKYIVEYDNFDHVWYLIQQDELCLIQFDNDDMGKYELIGNKWESKEIVRL